MVRIKALYARAVARVKACGGKQCTRVWDAARRPATAGALFLSYAGIIAVFAFQTADGASQRASIKGEAHQREADICMVIINVHENSKNRAHAAHQALDSTLDYLRDHKGSKSDLVRRVRQNLPNTRANVVTADDSVLATTVPPTCKPYLPGRHDATR